MQSAVNLYWLVLVLTGSPIVLALRRNGCRAGPHVVGVLVCAAFLLFPIISWDDDVLWAKASGSEAGTAWTENCAAKKRTSDLPNVLARALALAANDRVGVRACVPSSPVLVKLPHLSFPPLGQRPPPPALEGFPSASP